LEGAMGREPRPAAIEPRDQPVGVA